MKSNLNEVVNGKFYKTYQALSDDYPQFSRQVLCGRYNRGRRGDDLVADIEQHSQINETIKGKTYHSFPELAKDYPFLKSSGFAKRYKNGARGLQLIAPRERRTPRKR